jgi:hypothetical protein
MFNFKDPKSIILVLNFLHLRTSSAQCSNPLILKGTTDGRLCGYRKIGKYADYEGSSKSFNTFYFTTIFYS